MIVNRVPGKGGHGIQGGRRVSCGRAHQRRVGCVACPQDPELVWSKNCNTAANQPFAGLSPWQTKEIISFAERISYLSFQSIIINNSITVYSSPVYMTVKKE